MSLRSSATGQHFFTINEFTTFVEWGTDGLLAQAQLPPARLNQVRHHAVLAHGLLSKRSGRKRARDKDRAGGKHRRGRAIIETPEHITAAERYTREINAGYMT